MSSLSFPCQVCICLLWSCIFTLTSCSHKKFPHIFSAPTSTNSTQIQSPEIGISDEGRHHLAGCLCDRITYREQCWTQHKLLWDWMLAELFFFSFLLTLFVSVLAAFFFKRGFDSPSARCQITDEAAGCPNWQQKARRRIAVCIFKITICSSKDSLLPEEVTLLTSLPLAIFPQCLPCTSHEYFLAIWLPALKQHKKNRTSDLNRSGANSPAPKAPGAGR